MSSIVNSIQTAVQKITQISEFKTQKPTRLQMGLWVLLVLAALFLSLRDFDAYQLGTHYDGARYTILAESMVESDQYGFVNYPGEPLGTKYPFGYPLLLAPVLFFSGGSYTTLKVLSLAATLLNATLLFWGWLWFSRRSYWWGLGVTAVTILSPMAIGLTRRVMSEPIFITACLVAILLAEQAVHGRRRWWWWPAISLTLILVVFTRTIGVVLLLSIILYLTLHKGRAVWRDLTMIFAQMGVILLLIIAFTPVQIENLLPGQYVREYQVFYVNEQAEELEAQRRANIEAPITRYIYENTGFGNLPGSGYLLRLMITGELHIEIHVRELLIPLGGGGAEQALANRLGVPFLPPFFGTAVFGLVIFGFLRWWKNEGLSVFLLFGFAYLGAMFVWLWRDTRLLFPILSQLYLALFVGIEGALQLLTPKKIEPQKLRPYRHALLTSLAAAILLMAFYDNLRVQDTTFYVGDLSERTAWVRENTPETAVLLSESPEIDYLYGQRKIVDQPRPPINTAQLDGYLHAMGVNYVLIGPEVRWYDDGYRRDFSDLSEYLMPLLADLEKLGHVMMLHDDDTGYIEVFSVDQAQDHQALNNQFTQ